MGPRARFGCTRDAINNCAFGPAFNGESDGFVEQSCDLTPYAGQTVVLSFRYVTDGSVVFDGWWDDDVMVADTLISDGSTLEGWQSPTQYNPIEVERYSVRVVAYEKKHDHAYLTTIKLNQAFNGTLKGPKLHKAIGDSAEIVSVIVTYHDSTEMVQPSRFAFSVPPA